MGVEERRDVTSQVRARAGELQDLILATVQANVDTYRTLTPDQLRDVRRIATWALLRIVEAWHEGTELQAGDLTSFRGIGAARAEDGRPLPDVLRAYRVAAVAATDTILGIGGKRLDIDDVKDITRVVLTAIDQVTEAIIDGYAAAGERLASDRTRALRELLDDVLVGRQSTAGAFADRSVHLNYASPSEFAVLVAGPTDAPPGQLLTALATALLAELELNDEPTTHLITTRGNRAVLLLAADRMPLIDTALASVGWRGCVIPAADSTRVAAAHHLATHALDTAPAHAFHGRAALDEGDAQVLALLATRPAADLGLVATTVLGPLLELRNQHLLDGLTAQLAVGNATDASSLVGLHPQTMRYRLRRARELTGRDPRHPWHRLTLDIATHAVSIRNSRP